MPGKIKAVKCSPSWSKSRSELLPASELSLLIRRGWVLDGGHFPVEKQVSQSELGGRGLSQVTYSK